MEFVLWGGSYAVQAQCKKMQEPANFPMGEFCQVAVWPSDPLAILFCRKFKPLSLGCGFPMSIWSSRRHIISDTID